MRTLSKSKSILSVAVLALVVACSGGSVGEGQAVPTDDPNAVAGQPDAVGVPGAVPGELPTPTGVVPGNDNGQVKGPTAGRRLTKQEFVYTLEDLFGLEAAVPAARLAGETASQLRFRNDLLEVTVSDQRVAAYENLAEEIAAAVPTSKLTAFAACAEATAACQLGFVQALGRQMYRRPLSETEASNLTRLFAITQTQPFEQGARLVLRAMLQSPFFLYKVERQQAAPDAYEVATRLSFMLWKAAPDAALLDQAAANGLGSAEAVTAVAQSMLEDPRARRGVREFADDWLRVYNNLSRTPLPESGLTAPALAAMQEETLDFVERVLMDDQGPVSELLLNQKTAFGPELAPLYGVEPSPDGSYDLTPNEKRVGLLTQLAVLGSRAGPQRASVVDRGLTIAEDFLCIEVPPPPPEAQEKAADFRDSLADTASEREKIAVHNQEGASCGACHQLIDPFGLPFENYDVVGRYSDTDQHGNRLFGNGELNLDGVSQSYANVAEFAGILAASATAQSCMTRKFIQYTLGRKLTTEDLPLLDQVTENLRLGGGTYAAWVSAVVGSDAFRAVSPEVAAQ